MSSAPIVVYDPNSIEGVLQQAREELFRNERSFWRNVERECVQLSKECVENIDAYLKDRGIVVPAHPTWNTRESPRCTRTAQDDWGTLSAHHLDGRTASESPPVHGQTAHAPDRFRQRRESGANAARNESLGHTHRSKPQDEGVVQTSKSPRVRQTMLLLCLLLLMKLLLLLWLMIQLQRILICVRQHYSLLDTLGRIHLYTAQTHDRLNRGPS